MSDYLNKSLTQINSKTFIWIIRLNFGIIIQIMYNFYENPNLKIKVIMGNKIEILFGQGEYFVSLTRLA